jgi:HAD superfamily hydrolase (TIGR01509 family)
MVSLSFDAVLLDADGVVQLAPDYLHLRLTAALGRRPDEREACLDAIFAAEAPALIGAASFEASLAPALRALGAPCDAATVLKLWCEIDPDAAALALVARLRARGVFCALASNQERNRARHMSQTLGYARRFDREFYSCDLGCTKPSAEFFDEIVRRAALDPARTLFIDDRQDNVAAARACGLEAAQFVLWKAPDGAAALERLLAARGLL